MMVGRGAVLLQFLLPILITLLCLLSTTNTNAVAVDGTAVVIDDEKEPASCQRRRHEEEIEREPSSNDWPHFPLLLMTGLGVEVKGRQNQSHPLPLGVPFEFETRIFHGKCLIRFRDVKSDDPETHERYFESNSRRRRRTMQVVIQGRFRESHRMSDIFFGSTLHQPLLHLPPWWLRKAMNALIRKLAPGVIFDLESKRPKVLSMYAWSAHDFSIDQPGNEPDITGSSLPENSKLQFGDRFVTSESRWDGLSSPKETSKYEFDPELVYTFHSYDEGINYKNFTMELPKLGDYKLAKALGKQPLSIAALTKKEETVFSFNLWHESLLDL